MLLRISHTNLSTWLNMATRTRLKCMHSNMCQYWSQIGQIVWTMYYQGARTARHGNMQMTFIMAGTTIIQRRQRKASSRTTMQTLDVVGSTIELDVSDPPPHWPTPLAGQTPLPISLTQIPYAEACDLKHAFFITEHPIKAKPRSLSIQNIES